MSFSHFIFIWRVFVFFVHSFLHVKLKTGKSIQMVFLFTMAYLKNIQVHKNYDSCVTFFIYVWCIGKSECVFFFKEKKGSTAMIADQRKGVVIKDKGEQHRPRKLKQRKNKPEFVSPLLFYIIWCSKTPRVWHF